VRLVLGEARIGAVEQLGPSASAITALTSFEREGK
jgi:hypothetical protein